MMSHFEALSRKQTHISPAVKCLKRWKDRPLSYPFRFIFIFSQQYSSVTDHEPKDRLITRVQSVQFSHHRFIMSFMGIILKLHV